MSFSSQDPEEPPVIPPKRSSDRSTGSNGDTPHMTNSCSTDLLKIFQEAKQFPCYHGKLDSKQVETILRDHLKIKGSYLLRRSKRYADALTFSVVHTANHIYNFNVFWKKGKYTVTEALMFSSLETLIAHFEENEIPGNGTPGLYLKYPILCVNKVTSKSGVTGRKSPINFRKSPSKESPNTSPALGPKLGVFSRPSPPSSPNFVRKKDSTSDQPNPNLVFELRQNRTTSDLSKRPPMPIPREPIYDSRRHQYDIYSVPDDPDRDRFYDIRELCHRVDIENAKQSKKCTCGLYLYESTLVDHWMMHRDIEDTATKNKIFFVNTLTNEATWQLPNHIRKKMETNEPELWKKINALLQNETDLRSA